MQHYRESLRINPGYADAHNNLAALLEGQGKLDDASSHYFAALRIRPDVPDFYFNTARMFARQGKLNEAARQLEIALRMNPGYEQARQALDDLRSRAKPMGVGAR